MRAASAPSNSAVSASRRRHVGAAGSEEVTEPVCRNLPQNAHVGCLTNQTPHMWTGVRPYLTGPLAFDGALSALL